LSILFEVVFLFLLKIIPQIIAEIIMEKYNIIPSQMLPLIPAPMPDIIKAGPVLLQKPINLSHSFFDMQPLLYRSTETFTPIGNPQIIPIINADMNMINYETAIDWDNRKLEIYVRDRKED
jgi:hypothetical protein